MFPSFSLSRLPRIVFGHGVRTQLPELACSCGKRLLLVTGARHFQASRHWDEMRSGLKAAGLDWEMLAVDGEPSPSLVDEIVRNYRDGKFDVVTGIEVDSALSRLLEILGSWTERMHLPRLSEFSVARADIPRIVSHSRGSSMKTNPVLLTDMEIGEILSNRL